MQEEERFLAQLADGIIHAGGLARFGDRAHDLAREVWADLKATAPEEAYPGILEREELRFVCQWDEEPPVVTVMLWDDVMWRDVARIVLPGA